MIPYRQSAAYGAKLRILGESVIGQLYALSLDILCPAQHSFEVNYIISRALELRQTT